MGIDWEALFVPQQAILEVILRGTIIYLALFVALRLLPRRTIGGLSEPDLLIIVLIADAVQNGMAGGYHSVTEAIALAATILGWATLIDWLDFRFPGLRLAVAREALVIRDGKLIESSLRRQRVTREELLSHLRQHGQESADNVAKAYIEGDGQVSVILRSGDGPSKPRERKAS